MQSGSLAEPTFAPGIHICVYMLWDRKPCTYRCYLVIHICVYTLLDRRHHTHRCCPVIQFCVYTLLDRRPCTYRCYPVIHFCVYTLLDRKAPYIQMLLWSNICETCKLLYLGKIKQVSVLKIKYHKNQSSFLAVVFFLTWKPIIM